VVLLGVLGAVLASFMVAQVWRVRARQLESDIASGDESMATTAENKRELAKLAQLLAGKGTHDRSRCLSCAKQLRWYDLLPVVSWLSVGGKCRYCRAPIGKTELLSELLLAVVYVISALVWLHFNPEPTIIDAALFGAWLLAAATLVGLFVYDQKWFLLPDIFMGIFIGLGVVYAGLSLYGSESLFQDIISLAGAIGILSGVYLALYLVSKGEWIGFGDVKLGLGLALFLLDWKLAFIALFLANFIGCLIVLPGLLTRKLSRTARVPFGPMLIAGFVITFLAAPWVTNFIEQYFVIF